MPVAAIPIQAIPPPRMFRRKKNTRTLVSISEGTNSYLRILTNIIQHPFSLT